MIHPSWLRSQDWRFEENPREPNRQLQKLAREYSDLAELPPVQPTKPIVVDPTLARQIALIFDQTPDQSGLREVQDAYAALVYELGLQFELVSRGIKFDLYDDDDQIPYQNSADMIADVARGHLFVYSGGLDHSILSRKENQTFRAVHDVFGHSAGGFSFGPNGENLAWIEHCKLFTPLARVALTVETRFQNSWVNFFPANAKLPPEQRPYAEQKAIWPPPEYQTTPELVKAYRKFPGFMEPVVV